MAKYPQYFAPELRPFINKVWMSESTIEKISKEIPENFYQLRKIGEDDKFICNLVRKDMKKEFIIYINRNNISLDTMIELIRLYLMCKVCDGVGVDE